MPTVIHCNFGYVESAYMTELCFHNDEDFPSKEKALEALAGALWTLHIDAQQEKLKDHSTSYSHCLKKFGTQILDNKNCPSCGSLRIGDLDAFENDLYLLPTKNNVGGGWWSMHEISGGWWPWISYQDMIKIPIESHIFIEEYAEKEIIRALPEATKINLKEFEEWKEDNVDF